MSFTIYTESLEGFPISLTNGGADSDERFLADRDKNTLGLDVAAGTSTVEVEITTTPTDPTIDYAILVNLTTTASSNVDVYHDIGAGFAINTSNTDITNKTNEHVYISLSEQDMEGIRFDFERPSSGELELGCIFMGTEHLMPTNYRYNAPINPFTRGERVLDAFGRPRSYSYDTAEKETWDVVFQLTSAQYTSLRATLANAVYDKKPFFIKDTIRSSSEYYYVRLDSIRDNQTAADYFEVNLKLTEI